MDTIVKIENSQPILLGPNSPSIIIPVPKGIDYFNTIIHFRYPAGDTDRSLQLSFKTRDGVVFKTPLLLGSRGGQIDYQPYSDFSQGSLAEHVENMLAQRQSDLIFYELEVSSTFPIAIQIWAEDQVGGFM